ncbi:MAG: hypothetical protein JSW55_20010, partial [Chloroflexota bacterium]
GRGILCPHVAYNQPTGRIAQAILGVNMIASKSGVLLAKKVAVPSRYERPPRRAVAGASSRPATFRRVEKKLRATCY